MDERNSNENNDGISTGAVALLAWFIGLPLIVTLVIGVAVFGAWLIDLLPGPGWLTAIIILFICILYGWWSARRD